MTPPTKVFISAAEPSADQHAASLIRAVHRADPAVQFAGVAGPKMRDAGCETIFDITGHSAMLLGAVRLVGRAVTYYRRCRERFQSDPPDAVVVVDSPALHLRLARMARRLDLPVLYYIAPQLWAWGSRRISKLRRDVDELAVILPFEEAYFRERGVRATYVGHPLAEQHRERSVDSSIVARLRKDARTFVALLPGSRRHVVKEVLSGQIEVAKAISRQLPGASFGVSVASDGLAEMISRAAEGTGIRVVMERKHYAELLEAADLVLVASGTASLEVAMRGKPMIVMYNASRMMYHLVGRWMVRTPHLSLPNILAGRRIVPEFMPYYRSTDPISAAALELLTNDEVRSRTVEDLRVITEPLRGTDASSRTTGILMQMIERRRSQQACMNSGRGKERAP
ncbi:MAG: lipid-A-disaccharide synthase [Phycisphaerae bacterium]|nr:lipid-A-disaccharide synthase [Phycisphaerae bacterium]